MMTSPRANVTYLTRARWTAEDAREVLAAQVRSGLSVSAFAEQVGVDRNPSTNDVLNANAANAGPSWRTFKRASVEERRLARGRSGHRRRGRDGRPGCGRAGGP